MQQEDKIQELLIRQAKMFTQLERIISDIESEKEVRKRITEDLILRIRELEDWKNNLQGRIAVMLVVGGAIWGIVVLVIASLIKK